MKITFYLRDKREGNFSIEQIFESIGAALNRNYEVNYFYVDSTKSKIENILKARKAQGDINHVTGDVNWIVLGLDSKKTILTVHDIGHYVNTLTGIRKVIYGWLWWKIPLKKVKLISAISDFTKIELVRSFNISSEKIRVVYNPVLSNYLYDSKQINKSNPRILQIGSMKNKNVEMLLKAVEGISCTLVFLRRPDPKFTQLLKMNRCNYEFHTDLDSNEVYELYKSCDMLYFASTYEGFGMPIVEAQAVGRPVITSEFGAMKEIAGDAAYFVNPFDPDSIKDTIVEICENDNLRARIIEKGILNIERFSLNKIIDGYMRCYNE